MEKAHILHKIRTAVGRSAGEPPAVLPPPRLRIPEMSLQGRVEAFCRAIEKLAGKTFLASTPSEARAYVAGVIVGRTAVVSNAPLLEHCGISALPSVQSGITDLAALREASSAADVGVTSAAYALANTGTLVMLSSREEARMISLLPPVHVAVVPRDKILTGLDELLSVLPTPAAETSSMVLITGPSRTADIEQILVRGVHGPGEIHVVIV